MKLRPVKLYWLANLVTMPELMHALSDLLKGGGVTDEILQDMIASWAVGYNQPSYELLGTVNADEALDAVYIVRDTPSRVMSGTVVTPNGRCLLRVRCTDCETHRISFEQWQHETDEAVGNLMECIWDGQPWADIEIDTACHVA